MKKLNFAVETNKMKPPDIPYQDQIQAVATLSVHELLKKYVEDERYRLVPSLYLKIEKADLIDFFKANPSVALEHLANCESNRQKIHTDTNILLRDGERFIVAGLDHGKLFGRKEFQTLEEACAEYVLSLYWL
jgi:hypothetical protein